MKSFIAIKPFCNSGYYEEAIYDDYPEETYTSEANLTMNRYDVFDMEENGRVTVSTASFGVSMYESIFHGILKKEDWEHCVELDNELSNQLHQYTTQQEKLRELREEDRRATQHLNKIRDSPYYEKDTGFSEKDERNQIIKRLFLRQEIALQKSRFNIENQKLTKMLENHHHTFVT